MPKQSTISAHKKKVKKERDAFYAKGPIGSQDLKYVWNGGPAQDLSKMFGVAEPEKRIKKTEVVNSEHRRIKAKKAGLKKKKIGGYKKKKFVSGVSPTSGGVMGLKPYGKLVKGAR